MKGLFYGGGMGQLIAQVIGSASVVVATLGAAFVLMYAVKATGTLRVSKEGELEGLDIHEHGMPAYPEFVVHGYLGTSAVGVDVFGDGATTCREARSSLVDFVPRLAGRSSERPAVFFRTFSTRAFTTSTRSRGVSPSTGVASSASTTSIPSMTLPKAVYLPSSDGAGPVQIKKTSRHWPDRPAAPSTACPSHASWR